jgi:phage I-like protein
LEEMEQQAHATMKASATSEAVNNAMQELRTQLAHLDIEVKGIKTASIEPKSVPLTEFESLKAKVEVMNTSLVKLAEPTTSQVNASY